MLPNDAMTQWGRTSPPGPSPTGAGSAEADEPGILSSSAGVGWAYRRLKPYGSSLG
jgi:hypothetical protein